jgi:hypothetical protein
VSEKEEKMRKSVAVKKQGCLQNENPLFTVCVGAFLSQSHHHCPL